MELKHSLKNIIEVDYKDLENFIKDAFDIERKSFYSLVAENEWSNDSCYSVTVKNFTELNEWEQADITDIIDTNVVTDHGIHTILNALYEKNLIIPGEYIIKVSW